GTARAGASQQPPRHPLHGPHFAGFSGPRRHPGPRPADEPAAVSQSGDHRHEGFARHLCHHPGQRGPLQESTPAPPLRPQPAQAGAALHREESACPQEAGAGTVSAPKRKRDVPVLFWISSGEMEAIQQKMAQFGTKNLSAYLRKMAVDGYVVQLDLPELKELVSLLRRSSNNLNQLTRRVHETGRIYDADLEDIAQRQEQLWEGVKEILTQLSRLS